MIEHIGENFGRVRIGIGPKKPVMIDSADFVLGKFLEAQTKELPDIIKETISIANDYIASGELFAETRTVLF